MDVLKIAIQNANAPHRRPSDGASDDSMAPWLRSLKDDVGLPPVLPYHGIQGPLFFCWLLGYAGGMTQAAVDALYPIVARSLTFACEEREQVFWPVCLRSEAAGPWRRNLVDRDSALKVASVSHSHAGEEKRRHCGNSPPSIGLFSTALGYRREDWLWSRKSVRPTLATHPVFDPGLSTR